MPLLRRLLNGVVSCTVVLPIGLLLACGAVHQLCAAQRASGPNAKAEAAWSKLAAQIENGKSDPERLRQELLAFRRTYPGTPQAVRAAEALANLPSPLDKLDPAKIPLLDRFETQPKQLVAVLGEHRGRQGTIVINVAYSPNGKLVASTSNNGLLRLWDPATLRQRAQLTGYAAAFDRQSQRLAAAGLDGTVHIWDVTAEKPKELLVINVSSASTLAVAFSADGKRLATGSRDFLVRVWDLTVKEPKKVAELASHAKDVTSVAFAPDGKMLASSSYDKTVMLWDVSTEPPQKRGVLDAHMAEVYGVAFAPA